MPKWITFAFALFLSMQVFSTKGQDVDVVINKHLAALGENSGLKFKETPRTNGHYSEYGFASLLINYKTRGCKAELLGKEKVDGRACYQVRLTLQSGLYILYDIDAATWLISRQTGFTPQGEVINKE